MANDVPLPMLPEYAPRATDNYAGSTTPVYTSTAVASPASPSDPAPAYTPRAQGVTSRAESIIQDSSGNYSTQSAIRQREWDSSLPTDVDVGRRQRIIEGLSNYEADPVAKDFVVSAYRDWMTNPPTGMERDYDGTPLTLEKRVWSAFMESRGNATDMGDVAADAALGFAFGGPLGAVGNVALSQFTTPIVNEELGGAPEWVKTAAAVAPGFLLPGKAFGGGMTAAQKLGGIAGTTAAMETRPFGDSEIANLLAGFVGGAAGAAGGGFMKFEGPPGWEAPARVDGINYDAVLKLADMEQVLGGIDPRMVDTLRTNLYSGDLGKTSVKETIQNAVDAVRANPGGRGNIDVHFDHRARTMFIRDDGIGMTPDVARNQFLNIGASLKPGADSSGGFGIAKVAIFGNAEWVEVVTVARVGDKTVRTLIEGDGRKWLTEGFEIESREVPNDATTGTYMRIGFASDVKLNESATTSWAHEFKRQNRINGVKFGGLLDSSNVDLPHYTQVDTVLFEGGEGHVFASDNTTEGNTVRVHVLNNGLYQYSGTYDLKAAIIAPAEVSIDIRSDSGPESPNYAFRPDREGLREGADNALKQFFGGEFRRKAIAAHLKQMRQTFSEAVELRSRADMAVVDSTGQFDRAYVTEVANMPHLVALMPKVAELYTRVERGLRQVRPDMDASRVAGWGLGKYRGLHVYAESLYPEHRDQASGRPTIANPVLINPFEEYIAARAILWRNGNHDPTPAQIRKGLAGQFMGTIAHEVAHAAARNHEEPFALALTDAIVSNLDTLKTGGTALEYLFTDDIIRGFDAAHVNYESAVKQLGDYDRNTIGRASNDLAGGRPEGNSGNAGLALWLRGGLEEGVPGSGGGAEAGGQGGQGSAYDGGGTPGRLGRASDRPPEPVRVIDLPEAIQQGLRDAWAEAHRKAAAYPPGDAPELAAHTGGGGKLGNQSLGNLAAWLDAGVAEVVPAIQQALQRDFGSPKRLAMGIESSFLPFEDGDTHAVFVSGETSLTLLREKGSSDTVSVSMYRKGAVHLDDRNPLGSNFSDLTNLQAFLTDILRNNPELKLVADPTDDRRARVYTRIGFERQGDRLVLNRDKFREGGLMEGVAEDPTAKWSQRVKALYSENAESLDLPEAQPVEGDYIPPRRSNADGTTPKFVPSEAVLASLRRDIAEAADLARTSPTGHAADGFGRGDFGAQVNYDVEALPDGNVRVTLTGGRTAGAGGKYGGSESVAISDTFTGSVDEAGAWLASRVGNTADDLEAFVQASKPGTPPAAATPPPSRSGLPIPRLADPSGPAVDTGVMGGEYIPPADGGGGRGGRGGGGRSDLPPDDFFNVRSGEGPFSSRDILPGTVPLLPARRGTSTPRVDLERATPKQLGEIGTRLMNRYTGSVRVYHNEVTQRVNDFTRAIQKDKAAWAVYKRMGSKEIGAIIESGDVMSAPEAVRPWISRLIDYRNAIEARDINYDPTFETRMLRRRADYIGDAGTDVGPVDRVPNRTDAYEGRDRPYDAAEELEVTEYFPAMFKKPKEGWNNYFNRVFGRSQPGAKESFQRRRTRVVEETDASGFVIRDEQGRPKTRVAVEGEEAIARPRTYEEAIRSGLEPIDDNPAVMLAMRDFAGYRRIEKDILRKRLIDMDLAVWKVKASNGPPNASPGWEVPKVSGFDWRHIHGQDLDGGYQMPRAVATLLNDYYDVNSNETYRRVLRGAAKPFVMTKLLGFMLSLYQHFDVGVQRPAASGIAAFVRTGNPAELATIPVAWVESAAAAFIPPYREHLKRQWMSDPLLRGLTQEGANVSSTAEFMRTDLEGLSRDLTRFPWVGGAVDLPIGPLKVPFMALNAFSDYMSRGLFEGLYLSASKHMARDIHKAISKDHPMWTAAQKNAAAAGNLNTIMSGIENWQSVIRNEGVRDMLRMLLISFNEQEGMLRGFARGMGGFYDVAESALASDFGIVPRAVGRGMKALEPEFIGSKRRAVGATLSDNYGRTAEGKAGGSYFASMLIGHTAFLFLMANAINYAVTGELLSEDQLSPVRLRNTGGVPYPDFNPRFFRPVVGFTKLGQPIYGDLWGQLDTPLRWLADPVNTANNRLSQGTRFFQSMLTNRAYDGTQLSDNRNKYLNWAERAKGAGLVAFTPIAASSLKEMQQFDNPYVSVGAVGGVNVYAGALNDTKDWESRKRFRKDYDELGPAQREIINTLPNIVELTKKQADYFAERGDTFSRDLANLRESLATETKFFEDYYKGGGYLENPDEPVLPEKWHDLSLIRLGQSQAIAKIFEKTLAGFNSDQADKDLKTYFDMISKSEGGTISWPETTIRREAFIAGLAPDRRRDLEEMLDVIEGRRTPLQQEFRADMATLDAMGYPFGTRVTAAYQEKNVESDLIMWKWYGSSLNSITATNEALAKLDAGETKMPVKFANAGRRVDTDREMWQRSFNNISKYQQIDPDNRTAALRSIPFLNAQLVYWGMSSRLHTAEAGQYLDQYMKNSDVTVWNSTMSRNIVNYLALTEDDKKEARQTLPFLDAYVNWWSKEMYGRAPVFLTEAARQKYAELTGEDVSEYPLQP